VGGVWKYPFFFSFPSFVTSHSKVDLRLQLVVQYLYSVVFAGRDG